MSGGSFDYLCYAHDVRDLTEKGEALERMRDSLAGLGYAKDAAMETEVLIRLLRQTEVRVETAINRLSEVWRAMEWWQSYDSSEDGLKQALAKYRGEGSKDA
jgi:hypothetical protein